MTTPSPGADGISPEQKRAKLRELLEQARKPKFAPASYAQERLWVLDRLAPGEITYCETGAVRFGVYLDANLLSRLLQKVARRHEVLRTTFVAGDDGHPRQRIAPGIRLPVLTVDLTGLPASLRDAQAMACATAQARTAFDLDRGPLLRILMVRIAPDDHLLAFTLHHIIADGWSVGVLIRELMMLWIAESEKLPVELPKLPIQYADFVRWQREWLTGDVLDEQLSYWREQLAGLSALNLPTDRPRPAVQTTAGAVRPIELGTELTAALRALSRREGVTLYMTLLAAFHTLLMRYTGGVETDLVVGSPVAGRKRREVAGLIGFFVNMLPMRVDVGGDPTFRELLTRVQRTALDAHTHEDIPFEKVVDDLKIERTASRNPLFQVVFALYKNVLEVPEVSGISMQSVDICNGTSKYDLTLFLWEGSRELNGQLEYNTDLFDAETIDRMAGHLKTLLGAVVRDPEQHVSELPLLGEDEERLLVEEWNETGVDYPQADCLHALFEAQAARTPEAVAVVFDGELTYAELDRRANQLAHHLRGHGVGPESVVALSLEPSLEMVVGILGVCKAGAAYLPIHADYPAERVRYILDDAAAGVVLTQRHRRDGLPASGTVICLDGDWQVIAGEPEHDPQAAVCAENLAYVIYTSGSTGTPKGVQVTHANVARLFEATRAWYQFDAGDTWTLFHSFAFDFSVWEMWGALLFGGRLVVVPPDVSRAPAEFLELVRRERVTVLNQTPSAFRQLIRADEAAGYPELALRYVIFGGEALDLSSLAPWIERRGDRAPQLINMYGITETTVHVTYRSIKTVDLERGAGSVVGRQIPDLQIYILDGRLQPVPIGVPGEIHVGGAGLARGYLGRGDLTAERFIPDPFGASGSRLYRTGDLARYRPDGGMEYLGRIDHQVKIRGFRIELGEIETVLSRHPDLREAVVVAREDTPGDRRLVAYTVSSGDREIPNAELRSFLAEHLPDYMVPSAFIPIEAVPLTANGKLDRKRLPAPEGARPELGRAFTAPRNATEEKLAEIWAEVLGVARVGVHDNFFELGGDSILAIQVVSKANQAGLALSAKHLFQHLTIADLAAVAGSGPVIRAEQGVVSGPVPLTPIQRWFFEQDLPDRHHYNQSVVLRGRGALHPRWVAAAAAELVVHHDALRLRYHQSGATWHQVDADADGSVEIFGRVDLSGLAAADRAAALDGAGGELQASLDLEAGPLLRVVLFQLGDDADRVLVTIHHLAVDGVSWRVLLEDLATAYQQQSLGHAVQLPPKTTSFRHWAERLEHHAHHAELAAEAEFWNAIGDAAPLPRDHEIGLNVEASVETHHAALTTAETTALLAEVPAAYRTRINDVLLTALAQTLARWSESGDVVIDLEGHGREALFDDVDLSRTIGWFTTIYPVRLDVAGLLDDGGALKSIKEQLRAVPRHGIGFGLMRHLHPERHHALIAQRRPDVSFNYLGQFDQALPDAAPFELSAEPLGPLRAPSGRRAYLLDINAAVEGGRLQVAWSYSRNLHSAATIERLGAEFMAGLRRLIEHCQSPDAGGCTASDFPLAALDQARLDALVGTDRTIEDLYPLSPLQSGLLFHSLYDASSGMYVEQLSCTLSGIDPARFRLAWQQSAERHSILRTRFVWEGLDQPLQVVVRDVVLPWIEEDWRDEDPAEQQHRLEAFSQADRLRSFALDDAPLMRLALFRVADDTWRFLWSHHHLLLDGWSLAALLREVMMQDQGSVRGIAVPLDPPRPYRDYIARLIEQDPAAREAFWRGMLAGFDSPTPIGDVGQGQRGTPEAQAFADRQIRLSRSVSQALEQLGRTHQLTTNTIVQGAWSLLLSRYTGQRDVLYGTTVSGRSMDLQGVESMIGVFINTVPVRVAIHEDDAILSWLAALQEQQVEIRQFESSPLIEVQRFADLAAGVALFESLLIFENYPIDSSLQSDGLRVSDVQLRGRTHYPVTAIVAPGEEFLLRIVYDRRKFDDDTIARMLVHFGGLLEAIAATPEARLAELPMLTDAEWQRVVVDWNRTARPYPPACIHQLFEAQVARTPDATAVHSLGSALSYFDLNERANQLAHHLRGLGAGPETFVGICVERSLDMLVGIVGILKSGAAFVPLDPSHPQARLEHMLREVRAEVVVTQDRLAARLPDVGARLLRLDVDGPAIASAPTDEAVAMVAPHNAAYVIYTSGSMGRPKGVVVPHAALANYVRGLVDRLAMDENASFAMVQPLSVDSSQSTIFPPLIRGGCVHIISEDEALSADALRQYFERHPIDCLKIAPSHLAALHGAAETEPVFPRQRLVIGGEASRRDWVERLRARSGDCVIFNHYGPTEATVGMVMYRVPPQWSGLATVTVPIGAPMPNMRAHLLDGRLRSVPIGAAGELYIGGVGVARGYLDGPDLTAAVFVPDPFGDSGGRLYKTGDLCRSLPDGNLEFIGRIDQQVKIRGFRVEPGEVEAELARHPAVSECVVVARDDGPGGARLVAYAVATKGATPAAEELRRYMVGRVPEHMVPAVFTALDALPRTTHGKLDLKALPAPEGARPALGDSFVAPRTPQEAALARIWSEVLGVDAVGVHDNFFELGGHSLLAMQMLSRVREAFQVELQLRELFDAATVAAMAEAVGRAERRRELPPIEAVARGGPMAPSFAQVRLWTQDQLFPGDSSYNMPAAVRLRGPLDLEALQRSFDEIVRRHETLRTTFASGDDGAPVQVIAPAGELDYAVDQLDVPLAEREVEASRLALKVAAQPFDLDTGPLIRVRVLRFDPDDHVLLVVMHHIVSDGWSMGVFVREFAVLYRAFAAGESSPLSELAIQYADFAHWQRGWLQGEVLERHLAYWRGQLARVTRLQLPADRTPPEQPTNRGATRTFAWDDQLSDQVRELGRIEKATPFMVLLAAFDVVLHHRTGQLDIAIGTDVANRHGAETEALIGFFVNQLVVRTDLGGNPTFRELLARVQEVTLDAYAHQDLPFDRLVSALGEHDQGRSPFFDVKFVLQNAPLPDAHLAGIEIGIVDLELETTKFDILFNMRDGGREFSGQLAYSTDLFTSERIEKLTEQLEAVTRSVTADPDVELECLVEQLVTAEREERKAAQQAAKQANKQKLKGLRRSTPR